MLAICTFRVRAISPIEDMCVSPHHPPYAILTPVCLTIRRRLICQIRVSRVVPVFFRCKVVSVNVPQIVLSFRKLSSSSSSAPLRSQIQARRNHLGHNTASVAFNTSRNRIGRTVHVGTSTNIDGVGDYKTGGEERDHWLGYQ